MNWKSPVKSALYRARSLLPAPAAGVVLMYHSIGDGSDLMTVAPAEFDWQLGEISSSGYCVVTLAELERMLDKRAVPPKTVALTFDDGRKDNYTNAFPVLKKYRMPATIFVATDYIGGMFRGSYGDAPMLSAGEMHEMHGSGLIDLEPHTASHPNMKKLSFEEAREEVVRSKEFLENMLAKECAYFAYPHGKFTGETQEAAKAAGIRLAFSVVPGTFDAGSPRLALPRNNVDPGMPSAHFRGILERGRI